MWRHRLYIKKSNAMPIFFSPQRKSFSNALSRKTNNFFTAVGISRHIDRKSIAWGKGYPRIEKDPAGLSGGSLVPTHSLRVIHPGMIGREREREREGPVNSPRTDRAGGTARRTARKLRRRATRRIVQRVCPNGE